MGLGVQNRVGGTKWGHRIRKGIGGGMKWSWGHKMGLGGHERLKG